MPRPTPKQAPAPAAARVRRGYFECRYGQLHVHHAMPPGGGFEEGVALLCVHDCPGSGRMLAPFLALAGRDRSVYAPDLPGFGESDPPPAPPGLAGYAAALADFVDTMRLRRLDVLGVRTGALIAAELALARPEAVARVVMVSVPLGTAPAGAPPDAPEAQCWIAEGLAQYPARERLARLSARLLVLRPRDDLWDATARIREAIPAARVADLEGSARELLAASPQRLFDAVRDFLRG